MSRQSPAQIDHRRNTEDLLEQLAGLFRQDRLSAHLEVARRRRAVARRAIMLRMLREDRGRWAAA